jgi:hypothetical protein
VQNPASVRCFRFALAIALASSSLMPARASAAPPAVADSTTKEAKSLGRAGLTLFDKGDYAGALENFKRAYAMYPAPTLGVFTARSLEKQGRLREARDIYDKVIETPLERGAEEAFKRAVEDAKRERADVAARVPTLSLLVRGATDPVTATLDEKPLTPGAPIEVDPGDHKIEATAGARTEKTSVHVAPSEKREVLVDLTPLPPPVIAPPPTTSPLKTIGFVGLAIGGAGLVAGGVLGVAAIAQKSSIDASGACSASRICTPEVASKVASYDTLRTTSAIALYAGAGVAAIGVALIIAAPKRSDGVATALVIGPDRLQIRGRF